MKTPKEWKNRCCEGTVLTSKVRERNPVERLQGEVGVPSGSGSRVETGDDSKRSQSAIVSRGWRNQRSLAASVLAGGLKTMDPGAKFRCQGVSWQERYSIFP